ncbi:putative mitochondrial carrier [Neolecta irregularis DAH-3]|uniref:Putative mitochondrial carrier n=1 Tax=Neolecta irregularis (strain DAH-3) TaxID=1198029 RepID=A0A1U7LHH7_NEOID|nr:putative mitochondrial carrier [Neolecta irregularis DAH-3]|eukprot:OLL22099.1 putative mitochondrial carrier [Neolecta irregularis DAH-3]
MAAVASSTEETSGTNRLLLPKEPQATKSAFSSVTTSRGISITFVGGAVAGAVSRTVVSPLERIKILFQVQGPGQSSYNGVFSALSQIWKTEGWKGFMRGNGTNCIRIIPYSAVQFTAYSIYKKLLADRNGDLGTFRKLGAGAFAGITSVVATYPLDITRTRLSIQTATISHNVPKSQIPGMIAVMKQLYLNEGGIMALYRGVWPTLIGVAPYVGINFAVYEAIRTWMTPEGQLEPSAAGKLVSGALSGTFAQTMTFPADVLRRRFQVNTMSGVGQKYASIYDAIRSMYQQEGLLAFYKGLWPNLLKVAPSMAACFLTYEMTVSFLKGHIKET